jgi:hypothetical protein
LLFIKQGRQSRRVSSDFVVYSGQFGAKRSTFRFRRQTNVINVGFGIAGLADSLTALSVLLDLAQFLRIDLV